MEARGRGEQSQDGFEMRMRLLTTLPPNPRLPRRSGIDVLVDSPTEDPIAMFFVKTETRLMNRLQVYRRQYK